jgi:hypothetical protein
MDPVILLDVGPLLNKRLTHKEIEKLITQYFIEHGWVRVKDKRLSLITNPVDRLFEKAGIIVAIEIKPTDSGRKELLTGIGQCSTMLPYVKVKPYLLVDSIHIEYLSGIIANLPWLGLLGIDALKGQLIQYQKSEVIDTTRNNNLLVPEQSTQRLQLKQVRGQRIQRKIPPTSKLYGELQ